ncbi:MAG: hypothetical protein KGK07_05785 [Chloroflexota bacterium]|nr:hypothetical protein [Chloroflexota bacterium]
MRIWKLIASLVVVGVLASAAFASAALLNVTSQGLQAGGVDISGCQGAAPVDVTFTKHWDGSVSAFIVDAANVNGLAPACMASPLAGAHSVYLVLTLAPPAGAFIDLGSQTISGPTVTFPIPASQKPDAANLTDVHVLIK